MNPGISTKCQQILVNSSCGRTHSILYFICILLRIRFTWIIINNNYISFRYLRTGDMSVENIENFIQEYKDGNLKVIIIITIKIIIIIVIIIIILIIIMIIKIIIK